MNIAFFLMPKSEVVHMPLKSSMRQALEKMEKHHYTAIPLIDEDGAYFATLTEGDLLWEIKKRDMFSLKDAENISIENIELSLNYEAVSIYEDIQALLALALEQNFVPVVDDVGTFIGIVTRKAVIEYFAQDYMEKYKLKQSSTSARTD